MTPHLPKYLPSCLSCGLLALILLAPDRVTAQDVPLDGVVTNSTPYRRWLWWREDHGVEDERQAAFARKKALAEIERLKRVSLAAVVPGNAWQAIGPAPEKNGQTSPPAAVSGRIAEVTIDPSNPAHWLIGGAQGGVWETRNSGTTWKPCTDDAPSLAMGAIAFAPGAPAIVYAGTGEQAFSGDAHDGAGLLKSFDGGTTWQVVESLTFLGTRFGEIRVHPNNPDILVAATSDGIFKSTDGGVSWDLHRSGTATDLEVHPSDFSRQYGSIGDTFANASNDAYRSLDSGVTWKALGGPWKTAGSVGRIEMALSPSAPDTLYVSVHNTLDGRSLGVWRTDNAWDTTPIWKALPKPTSGTGNLWYNHDIIVDPTDPSIVYLAAGHVLKFANGTWLDVLGTIHVDQHALAWAGTRLVVGNDGGCWSTRDGGATYANHNTNLQLTQFYHGAVHPTNPNVALGGTQDNGTVRWSGLSGGWSLTLGGDGADCGFSVSNPNLHWAGSYQDLEIQRTLNGGNSWTSATGGIESTNRPFIGAFAMGLHQSDLLITGTRRVYKCTNFFSGASPAWFANSPDFGAGLRSYAFAKSDPSDRTYCVGVSGGATVMITTNGGTSWNSLDKLSTLPNRTIRDFAFHPTNPNILYAALSGFSGGKPQSVFVCSNALASSPRWQNISPPVDLPALVIAIDQEDPRILYIGSDIGVWRSPDGGTSWSHMGPETGLPNVEVDDLKLSNASGRLTAFTHGRGAFTLFTANGANLALKTSVSPTGAAVGCDLTFTFVITNGGPLKATGVRLTNQLSSSLEYQSTDAAPGEYGHQGARTIFDLGSISAGDARIIKLTATARALGTVTSIDVVRADQPDPAPADNSTETSASIVEDSSAPELVSATASPDGTEISLTFNESIHERAADVSQFTLLDGTLRPLKITQVRLGSSRSSLILSARLLDGLPPYHLLGPAFADCSGNQQLVSTHLSLDLASVTLIKAGSVWRFLDDGSDQGTAWRRPTFDDTSWNSGPARLGYGGDGEVTTIGFGPDPSNKFITTYFRHEFSLPHPEFFSKLNLAYSRDDGVAAYLNDKQILRSNLASNAGYNGPALSTINGVDETLFSRITGPSAPLVAGKNVVAAELHQAAVDSSDLGWDFELTATFTARPDLVDSDHDGIPDAWEIAHGLTPSDAADSEEDPDRDGLSNFQEYLAGTDPQSSQSLLRLEAAVAQDRSVTIQFLASSNRWYSLERRLEAPTGTWSKWEDIEAAPTNRIISRVEVEGLGQRFYRVVTPSAP